MVYKVSVFLWIEVVLQLRVCIFDSLEDICFSAGDHLTEEHVTRGESTLSITVVGASGDLAKKKIFPALFALFYEGCLPQDFSVFGYSRTKLSHEELRDMISRTLTCRIDQRYSANTF